MDERADESMSHLHLTAWATAAQFLAREAAVLDSGDYKGWLELLAEDIQYQVPVRATRYGTLEDEFSATSFHFDEDFYSLTMRVNRLDTKFAWAEDPPTRVRHIVGNVLVRDASDDRIEVSSAFLLYRSRLDEAQGEVLSGLREDRLVREGPGWRLGRRTAFLDQTVLAVSTLSTFL